MEVAAPSQLHSPQHGVDAEDSSPLQDLRVQDPLLPSQLQYSAEAAEMEVIQLPVLVTGKTIDKDTGELISPKRQAEAHQVIIDTLRQTGISFRMAKATPASRRSAFGRPLQKMV
ncbi:unnamed protein product [Schistocephalus solidus]|uniref:DEF8 n=1 Tax=Schistocephalus solidus TaxID=70667 RepID=A0A183TD10_SCHSO|nr:unnamed protein product [Schistocephalus solidus]